MNSRAYRERRRRYSSELRAEQARATRTRILDAVIAEFASGAGDLEVPALARRARVSVPTVYRHFPNREALLLATVDHVDALVPWPGPEPDPHDLAPFVRAFFEHRARVAAKLGPIGDSPVLWEARQRVIVPRRRQLVDALVARIAPKLREPHRTWLADILVVLFSSTTAAAFHKYVDCDPAETAARVTWIVEALGAASRRPRTRSGS